MSPFTPPFPDDGLPRLFDRAAPATRRRFAEVMTSFRAGEELAAVRPLDLAAVRAADAFAFEGVGLHLASHQPAALAALWPRLRPSEAALVAIGVGWAADRRSRPFKGIQAPAVPSALLGAHADGCGFHRALFRAFSLAHPRRFLADRQADFDRGVGRGAYFALGARPARLAECIERFPSERRPALWTGAGAALAFTGGLGRTDARDLAERGGQWLAKGVREGSDLRAHLDPTLPAHTHLALEVST